MSSRHPAHRRVTGGPRRLCAGRLLVTVLGVSVGLAAVPGEAGVFVVRDSGGQTKIVNVPGIERGGGVPSGSSDRRKELWPAVEQHARATGVDPALIDLMIRMESGYNSRAVSSKGARGVMQLMPDTARRYGVTNPFNAYENIRAGIRYFGDLLEKFGSDLALALAAYNAGPEAVTRHGGVPPYRETRNYVGSILAAYQGGNGGPALGGGFGKPVVRRPVELHADARGTVVTNTPRRGEPEIDARLSLR